MIEWLLDMLGGARVLLADGLRWVADLLDGRGLAARAGQIHAAERLAEWQARHPESV